MLSEDKKNCLSQLDLYRLAAGEKTDLESVRAHLETCSLCREKWNVFHVDHEQFLENNQQAITVKADQTWARYQAGKRSAWAGLPFGLQPLIGATAAVAIAICFVWWLFQKEPQNKPDSILTKGDFSFQVFAVDQGIPRPVRPDEKLAPGQQLLFRVTLPKAGWVLLGGIQEHSQAYILEHQEKAPWKMEASALVDLPVSARLDDSQDDERFFVATCEVPLETSLFLKAIENAYPEQNHRRDLATEHVPSSPGCLYHSWLIHRR